MTYTRGGDRRAGLLVESEVFDVANAAAYFKVGDLPATVEGLLGSESGKELRLLQRHLEGEAGETELPRACRAGLDEVTVCAPIARPPKIICLGLNYRDHAAEQNRPLPDRPLLFAKTPTSVIGPDEPIVIPDGFDQVDYECELALVIGRKTRRAHAADAGQAIFGYTCMNDVTERRLQAEEKLWLRGKGSDTFAPLGPWIVTPDQLGDPLNLEIKTTLNSEVMQQSSTANLILKPEDIVAFVTETVTLEPGDVISTGTPGGVGVFRQPQVFLRPGDIVEVSIEGIGKLANQVVAEK
jgi:2-keto-4-pentenoate hydratase/2-oxohepta-3-ene-1,7-dioic acid hydratase in catechol pathway